MNDEAFNLTPLDIRKQEFRKSLRGYDTLGVEEFQIRVADALERAIRERQVLEERVAALTEQLRVFREREKAMNDALVAAQQLRQETRDSAEREGQVIVREAQSEAKRLLDEAKTEQSAVEARMAETERQFQQYVGGFRALLERQIAELRALDGKK
jgi:DivIVA domain-containing protein